MPIRHRDTCKCCGARVSHQHSACLFPAMGTSLPPCFAFLRRFANLHVQPLCMHFRAHRFRLKVASSPAPRVFSGHTRSLRRLAPAFCASTTFSPFAHSLRDILPPYHAISVVAFVSFCDPFAFSRAVKALHFRPTSARCCWNLHFIKQGVRG